MTFKDNWASGESFTAAEQNAIAAYLNQLADAVPVGAFVSTSDTTTSTTYTALTSVGPSPSCKVGPAGSVLVCLYANMSNSVHLASCFMSFTGGGAAADDRAIRFASPTSAVGGIGGQFLVTGLTPGATFSVVAQYKVSSGTGTFSNRRIALIPR